MKLPRVDKDEVALVLIGKFGYSPDEALDYIAEFPNRALWWYWKLKVDAMEKNNEK